MAKQRRQPLLNLAAQILQAQLTGQRLAPVGREILVGLDTGGSRLWGMDFDALVARAGAWQARFATCGLGAGQSVAMALQRGPDMAPLHLAALAGGHPIVPLNTAMTVPEVRRVLDAASPALVVAAPRFLELHGGTDDRRWVRDELDAPASTVAASSVRPLKLHDTAATDPALVIFTSGTTGTPKSVPLSHGNLFANLETLGRLWERNPADRLLHVLPAHHYHGLVLALYGTLLAASTAVILPAFDARATLTALTTHRIDVLMAVPTIYARLLEASTSADHWRGLRLAVSGSAPLPAALWEAIRERFGISLVNRYGLTETGIVTTTLPRATAPGTVGLPLPGTTIVVRTDAGSYEHVMAGQASARGEICIAGPTVMSGYGNAPEANATAFANGWFHSGDLGHFDEHGRLWVDGRIKELIIVGGSNVVPGEIEAPLSQVDGVLEVVACGMPHHDLGEVVAAYVVARPGHDPVALRAALQLAAEQCLAPYKRPRAYHFLTEIPRNAMGKIDRSRLATTT